MPVCLFRQKALFKSTLLLLCLMTATPMHAQQGGDKPPPSATILSVTDLPDSPVKRKKGARRRVVRLHGKRAVGAKRFQTTAQRRVALQRKRQQLLATAEANRAKTQRAAQKAQEKPKEIAQKITEKQNTHQEKATPPQVTLQNPPPQNTPKQPEKNPTTEVAQKTSVTATKPEPVKPNPTNVAGTMTNTSASKPNPSPVSTTGTKPNEAPTEKKPDPVAKSPAPLVTNSTTPSAINPNVLKDTKPDNGVSSTQPKAGTPLGNVNPLQGILALLATIVITLGGLTLLRRYMGPKSAPAPIANAKGSQAKAKRGLMGGLLGGALGGKARDNAGSNIRLIETMPTGNNSFIHLVEVHGKQFVVGATPWQISMLTEVGEENLTTQAEFREILRTAAGELMQEGNEAGVAMNSLDMQLRDTSSAVVQNIDRIRNLRTTSRKDN